MRLYGNCFVFSKFQNLLNFTYSLKKPSDGQWGASISNGSYTGMIGALQQKEADFGSIQIFDIY